MAEAGALTDKIILLGIGFLLTTLLGGVIGFVINRQLWQTQTRHLLYRSRFDEGVKFLDELSELVGRRYFLLQRLLWALQEDYADKADVQKEYFLAVREWNFKYWRFRNKIRLLVGERQANQFLDYRDDFAGDDPASLHYMFVVTHRKVMSFKGKSVPIEEVEAFVVKLNWKCSVFLEQITSDFIKRSSALQLLRVPDSPGGAELAAPHYIGRQRPAGTSDQAKAG